jgi:hypothetical protein
VESAVPRLAKPGRTPLESSEAESAVPESAKPGPTPLESGKAESVVLGSAKPGPTLLGSGESEGLPSGSGEADFPSRGRISPFRDTYPSAGLVLMLINPSSLGTMIFIPNTYQNASCVFCVAQFRDETGWRTDTASSSPLREEKVLLFLTISS